ncbi:MAG TPA: MFS transporter, partial [Lacisediminihabitans sp.]
QQIGGSIGTAVFSSLAALATSRYLATHGTTRTADATIASYHLVFWIAAAVLTAAGLTAALLFRSGPIPATPGEPATP